MDDTEKKRLLSALLRDAQVRRDFRTKKRTSQRQWAGEMGAPRVQARTIGCCYRSNGTRRKLNSAYSIQ